LNHSIVINFIQKSSYSMKQHISYQMDGGLIAKNKSKHCGFDLCPKKFTYLGNPQLLEKIFHNSNRLLEIQAVKTEDPEDLTYSGTCKGCGTEMVSTFGWLGKPEKIAKFSPKHVKGIFFASSPICTECRRKL